MVILGQEACSGLSRMKGVYIPTGDSCRHIICSVWCLSYVRTVAV